MGMKWSKSLLPAVLVFLSLVGCTPAEEAPAALEEGGADIKPTVLLGKKLADLTEDDILYIDSEEISADELVPALQEAARQQSELEAGGNAGYTWTLRAWTEEFTPGTFKGGDEISMSASLEKNIVEIAYAGARISSENAILYEVVTSIHDNRLSIDAEALERYKAILDAKLEARLNDLKQLMPRANFTGAEVLGLEAVATYDDIFSGTVFVYQTAFGYIAEQPEHIAWAGGMVLDSQRRLHGFDIDTILVIAEENGQVRGFQFVGYDIYHGETEELQQENGYATVSQVVLEGLEQG